MKTSALVAAVAAVAVVATACTPKDPGPTGLYRGKQANIHPVVTPEGRPVTWGSAPVIDEHYGGTLYAGTPRQQPDSRPALVAGGREPLRLWVADPKNGRTDRPAILWFHGGGFAVGIDSMYVLARGTAQEYAQRGYVGFSVEYRTDTTQVGTGTDATALCQWVQDNVDRSSQVWIDRKAQCERNIRAAGADALAAVRWVRAHASTYGIDPNKVAIGGSSAGAVIADLVAYQHEDVGTTSYFAGDDRSVAKSKVQASFGASGCLYGPDLGPPTTIGAGDSPTSGIHSEFDQAVPYDCAATMVRLARSKGLVAEMTSYCGQSGHAGKLYAANQAATDEQWTTFLTRQLGLYVGSRPPSAKPLCP
ncbi:MAG: alpha/beta hydrolase [Acidimicrobiales bacterium]